MATAPLKFLFGVRYRDGSEFYQTQEDSSTTRAGGSAFTDVRQDEVHLFQLADGNGSRWLVDLDDGHFEINEHVFFAQIPPPGAVLRLIYFRRVRIHFQTGDGAPVEQCREVEYHFGWQTTHEGKNYQQTLILT